MNKKHTKSQYVVILADIFSSSLSQKSSNSIPSEFFNFLNIRKLALKKTYDFYAKFIDKSNIYIASSQNLSDFFIPQFKNVSSNNFVALPENQNQASIVAYLSFKLFKLNNDSNVIFSPCDVVSQNEDALITSMIQSLDMSSQSEALIVLGSKSTNFQAKSEYFEVNSANRLNQLYSICDLSINPKSRLRSAETIKRSFFLNSKIIVGKSLDFIDMYREYDVEDFIVFHDIYKHLNTDNEAEAVDNAFQSCCSISFENLLLKNARHMWLKEVALIDVNHISSNVLEGRGYIHSSVV